MEIEKAFRRLLVKSPFYGMFSLSLPKEVTTKINTLCVMKQGISCKLCINPDFWSQHTDDEQIALLTHELSHICLQHMFLQPSFKDAQLFNMAADAEVNSYIPNLPVTACTANKLNEKYGLSLTEGLGTKRFYEEIEKALQQQQQAQAQNPQKPCNGGKGGTSQQSSSSPSDALQNAPSQEKKQQPSPSQEEQQSQENAQEEQENVPTQYPDEVQDEFNPVDDHSTWKEFSKLPEAVKQLMANNINSVLRTTAEQVTKMHGTIPSELTEIIQKLQEKRPEVFDWKSYFRRILGSIYDVNIKSTRRKESKRFEGSAGVQHKKKVSILVAVDTSGSVSTEELKEFFSEIDYVYNAGARVTIIECDARINSITEYDGKHIPEIKGRGGKMRVCASLCSNA